MFEAAGGAYDHMVWRKACGLYGVSFAEKFCRYRGRGRMEKG